MTLKIDRAGRIVLPKRIRERLQLKGGSELELEENANGLLLRPLQRTSPMARKNGLWVHRGKLPKGVDWDSLISESRDERVRDLSGK